MLTRLSCNRLLPYYKIALKCFSTSQTRFDKHQCKLLVVGGGSGGCSVSAKFCKSLKDGQVIIVEPSDKHYYQPMFTLIGGGIKTLEQSCRNMGDVLPKKTKWVKDRVVEFSPGSNSVTLSNGDTIAYDFMLVATGLQLDYNKIPGLEEALQVPDSGVCSIYSPKYVSGTYKTLQKFEEGNAVFTYPNTPVKCAGAPQKICYLTEHFLRKVGKRKKANIHYNTSLPVIFGVKKYADALWKVVKDRDINVNVRSNLIELDPDQKVATFQNLDKPEEKTTIEYSMLHVAPPMSTPNELAKCSELVNDLGYVSVNQNTLQHVKFSNVFAIGDCSSTPNSKTAAAAAAQCEVVYKNLKAVMQGEQLPLAYDGYSSCPLVTGYGTVILAEFDYNLNPLETFPISQDKERWLMYVLKKEFLPRVYWDLMMKGHWNGPETARKIMHFKF